VAQARVAGAHGVPSGRAAKKWRTALALTNIAACTPALRAGVFELLERPEVPLKVVINEYVEVAHAFFDRGEPGMVNAVLDKLGRILRPAAEAAARPAPLASEGG
jgi:transcription termination factor NusB